MTHRKMRVLGLAGVTSAVVALSATALALPAAAAPDTANSPAAAVPGGYSATVFATAPAGTSGPDDITQLGGRIYVGFQNGIGAKGEPSPTGQTASTVIEYTPDSHEVTRWTLTGKVDGLKADPAAHTVLATVNEDANTSFYAITPATKQVRHYTYSPNPLPHGGGTDSITVRDGVIYVVASAPAAAADGKTYTGPALYRLTLTGTTAHATPVIADNATATDAVTGKPTTLNLSDPDSSELVPSSVHRFGGDFLLDSQGDSQLVFLDKIASGHPVATVLNLSTQVDDTAFATRPNGTLYVVDGAKNDILALHGPFRPGAAFTSVPNDSTTLAGTLGSLDLATGKVTAFGTGLGSPKGLLFAPDGRQDDTDNANDE
jgi:hypothetical protein